MATACKDKDIVLGYMRKCFSKSVKLPEQLDIKIQNDQYTIILNVDSIESDDSNKSNMQKDPNAFESWAFAICASLINEGKIKIDKDGKVKDDNIIKLEVDAPFSHTEYEGHGHYGRFLYRAMRFEEQYKWFCLSDGLKNYVEDFKQYLLNNDCTNNIAGAVAGTRANSNKENIKEAEFGDEKSKGKLKAVLNGTVDVGDEVFRQLPVGLFKGDDAETGKEIFTGKKSAIDLWTFKDKTFQIVELKVDNKMVGIITEIFFYSNYVKDLLLPGGWFKINNNIKNSKKEDEKRGYEHIKKETYEKINGIMMANVYHPIINNEKILELMNDNQNCNIQYFKAEY